MKHIRHGDVNMIPQDKMEGEVVKHNGSFVLALGETTGHKHLLTVIKPSDLVIKQDKEGSYYFQLKSDGEISHEEHKTLTIKKGIYKKVIEREVDHFADSIIRQVID